MSYEQRFLNSYEIQALQLQENTERQISSAFNVMTISKIDIKPTSSDIKINNILFKRQFIQGKKKTVQSKKY